MLHRTFTSLGIIYFVIALTGCGSGNVIRQDIMPTTESFRAVQTYELDAALWISEKERNYVYQGGPSKSTFMSKTIVQMNLGAALERESLKVYTGIFPNIKVIRDLKEASGNTIVVKPSLKSFFWETVVGAPGCDCISAAMEIEIAIMKGGEIIFSNKYKKENMKTQANLLRPESEIAEDVARITSNILMDMLVSSAREIEGSQTIRKTVAELEKKGTAALIAEAKTVDAVYRVVGLEALVRKLPKRRSTVIKKVPQGSLVAVTGILPNGWLRVAQEGEAIGWVYHVAMQDISAGQSTEPAEVPGISAKARPRFATEPITLKFTKAQPRPDDIAVIIGNADYGKLGRDIPDVVPAYADAEGMRRYITQALGVSGDNVIFLKDAKQADLVATFGSETNYKGQLHDWIEPGQSRVFVYYSGHGAPGEGGTSYLVPADAQAARIHLNGYPLKTLYRNLSKLPAKSVTVVLEACFSGSSDAGSVISSASPVYLKAAKTDIPLNITVVAAGAANQIASWEEDKSHGLFTKYFLLGMSGEADAAPHGNGDGKVGWSELKRYLKKTVTRLARRYYGREQTPQIVVGPGG